MTAQGAAANGTGKSDVKAEPKPYDMGKLPDVFFGGSISVSPRKYAKYQDEEDEQVYFLPQKEKEDLIKSVLKWAIELNKDKFHRKRYVDICEEDSPSDLSVICCMIDDAPDFEYEQIAEGLRQEICREAKLKLLEEIRKVKVAKPSQPAQTPVRIELKAVNASERKDPNPTQPAGPMQKQERIPGLNRARTMMAERQRSHSDSQQHLAPLLGEEPDQALKSPSTQKRSLRAKDDCADVALSPTTKAAMQLNPAAARVAFAAREQGRKVRGGKAVEMEAEELLASAEAGVQAMKKELDALKSQEDQGVVPVATPYGQPASFLPKGSGSEPGNAADGKNVRPTQPLQPATSASGLQPTQPPNVYIPGQIDQGSSPGQSQVAAVSSQNGVGGSVAAQAPAVPANGTGGQGSQGQPGVNPPLPQMQAALARTVVTAKLDAKQDSQPASRVVPLSEKERAMVDAAICDLKLNPLGQNKNQTRFCVIL